MTSKLPIVDHRQIVTKTINRGNELEYRYTYGQHRFWLIISKEADEQCINVIINEWINENY